MSVSAWTEDRIGRLKTLWLEGQSAEQIARDLAHGISRNAVLGKVHRLGLSAGRAAGAVTSRARVRSASALPARLPAGNRPIADCAPSSKAGSATLLSVGRSECRWPLGDPRDADFTLCGRPVARCAYCAAHAAIAYRPGRETPQSLERLVRLG